MKRNFRTYTGNQTVILHIYGLVEEKKKKEKNDCSHCKLNDSFISCIVFASLELHTKPGIESKLPGRKPRIL